ncbi:MAG: AAA family ATPase [Pseudomonadota bacterium]|nr:AAA family ATPase [Pseudomonadota bacterium]MDP1902701.1 AAA family ATPase [Pseudomonadota bacterium]MDP2351037.1 AAA family ATPase [Pseudomonadota bacterium]
MTPALQPLIAALLDPAAYPHPAPAPRLIETHISWVILAGDYAYKLKKPLELGFLDFSSLDKREHYCREEVRLNARLAPDIYLGVVPIAGSPPRIEGEGPVLEWAVKMRAFPADATLDREPEITADQIDAIADTVARFHGEIAPVAAAFGTAEAVQAPVAENFRQLRAKLPLPDALLDRLEAWSLAEGQRLTGHFAARKEQGHIRECHGDLHLGNIAWLTEALPPPPFEKVVFALAGDTRESRGEGDLPLSQRGNEGDSSKGGASSSVRKSPLAPLCKRGEPHQFASPAVAKRDFGKGGRPLIFDGIEFNPGLRCIDCISDVAFLGMDLMHRGLAPLAWRFLDRYLQHTGDYAGLAALPYYLVYRALVRAKVAALRASQSDQDLSEALSYLALAERFTRRPAPALLLMHGVSGSGKTWFSQHLLEQLPAIRVRSDVERKRLYGLDALADSRALGENIYSREAGERTLARLLEVTQALLNAGFRVIVDATFIKRDWREPLRTLAETLALPWFIIALEAPAEVLRQRLLDRQAAGRDASEAGVDVLAAQLTAVEAFSEFELSHVVRPGLDANQALRQIQAVLP